MRMKQFTCARCSQPFERRNGKRVYKHCGLSCSAKAKMETGASGWASNDARLAFFSVKVGEEQASSTVSKRREVRSERTRVRNTGKQHSPETRAKISASCTGVPNALKGKTYEEFYGHERANQLSTQHSLALKEGYASGALAPTTRTRHAPVFREVRLRSMLEQRAIEFLEGRDNLVFGQTLLYEEKSTRTKWLDENGEPHTYHPDLYDTVNDIVYEVKPAWQVERPTQELVFKHKAMLNTGRTFVYLTDRELKNPMFDVCLSRHIQKQSLPCRS